MVLLESVKYSSLCVFWSNVMVFTVYFFQKLARKGVGYFVRPLPSNLIPSRFFFLATFQEMLASSRSLTSFTKTLNRRLLSTKPVVPRILDKRTDETGTGGRGSDAGLKVAVFGASGMLGRYVCCHLGKEMV
jgi:hypothetical protein